MFTYLAGFPLTLPLVELTATEWVQANETPVEKNSYRVRGLPVGEKMLFRVTAVNIAGRSPPAVLAQAVTIREIVGETLTYIHTQTTYNRRSGVSLDCSMKSQWEFVAFSSCQIPEN